MQPRTCNRNSQFSRFDNSSFTSWLHSNTGFPVVPISSIKIPSHNSISSMRLYSGTSILPNNAPSLQLARAGRCCIVQRAGLVQASALCTILGRQPQAGRLRPEADPRGIHHRHILIELAFVLSATSTGGEQLPYSVPYFIFDFRTANSV